MLRSSEAIRELERALSLARGREIAGLLLETPAGEQRIRLTPNLLSEPGATEVPGWWLDRMLERSDPSGNRPVAFLHSHTSTLHPSATDRASMRRIPLPWIIVRLDRGRLSWVVLDAAASHVVPGTRASPLEDRVLGGAVLS